MHRNGAAPYVGSMRLEAVAEGYSALPARTTCSRGKVLERVRRRRSENGNVPPIVQEPWRSALALNLRHLRNHTVVLHVTIA
jgi:hypothetical protein